MSEEIHLTIKGAARYAQCSANQIRWALKQGALPYHGEKHTVGRYPLGNPGIKRGELLEWRLNTVNYFAFMRRKDLLKSFLEFADPAKLNRKAIEDIVQSIGMVMDCLVYCDLDLSPEAQKTLEEALERRPD